MDTPPDWRAQRDVLIDELMAALRSIGRTTVPRRVAWHVSALAPAYQLLVLEGVADGNPRKILHRLIRRVNLLGQSGDGNVQFGRGEPDDDVSTDHSSDFDESLSPRERMLLMQDAMTSEEEDDADDHSSDSNVDNITTLVRRHE